MNDNDPTSSDRDAFFRSVLESAPDAMIVVDGSQSIVLVNSQTEKLFGYDRDELIGRPLDVLIPDRFRERHRDHMESYAQHSVKRPMGTGVELLALRKDGTEFGADIALSAQQIGGRPHYIAAVRDATSQREAEQALRRSEMRYRELFENANDIVYTTDLEGRFESLNKAGEEITGYSRDEVIGADISLLVPLDQLDLARAMILRKLTQQIRTTYELEIVAKDGRRVPVEVGTRLIYEHGEPVAIQGICHDLTLHKRVEQQLREAMELANSASKAKGAFLANMSHEIRTPMNAILGMTELLLDTPLTPRQAEHCLVLRESAESLLVLLNDILDYSRIEQDRLALEEIEFGLEESIRSVAKSLEVQAVSKGLSLVTEVESRLPARVIGDPTRLRQILVNLIGNAVKFTSQGAVTVRARQVSANSDGIVVRVEVVDTGIGIAPEKRDHIYDAFEQVDPSIARRYGGTGLGLAITSGLLSLMGGSIQFESEVEQGTKFIVTVPFRVAPTGSDEKSTETTHSPQLSPADAIAPGLRVLVAEDQKYNQTLMKALLAKWGHESTIVGNGRAALEILAQQAFDLVLMDVRMPEMDGLEATRLFREREDASAHRTPIIAMTAEAMEGDADACLEAGMDAYLAKPIRSQQLLDAIAQFSPRPASESAEGACERPESVAASVADSRQSPRSTPRFDWSPAMTTAGGSGKLLARIVSAFLEEFPDLWGKLLRAADMDDAESLHLVSHGFKGAMQTLGADRATALAQELETMAKNGDLAEAMDAIGLLSIEMDLLLPVFTSFVESHRGGAIGGR